MNFRKILDQMGYRPDPRLPGTWLKPVGYSLFSFQESNYEGRMEWGNRFKGMNGLFHVWNTKDFSDVKTELEFFRFLQECEGYTRTDLAPGAGADFRMRASSEFWFDGDDGTLGDMKDPIS